MGFSRQEYWSGLPFPLTDPGTELASPTDRQILYQLSYQGSPYWLRKLLTIDFFFCPSYSSEYSLIVICCPKEALSIQRHLIQSMDISPFISMMFIDINIWYPNHWQPWCTPFPIWNQSLAPCPVLTVASWPADRFPKRQIRWSGIPISWRIFHSLLWSTQSKDLT